MIIALRATARHIEDGVALSQALRCAADDADRIPRGPDEKFKRGVKGKELMPMARGLMRALRHEPPHRLPGCITQLRQLADMLEAPVQEVSFVQLGRNRKPRIAA